MVAALLVCGHSTTGHAASSRMHYSLPPYIELPKTAQAQSVDGLGGNSVVDIVDDGTYIWAGTDRGASRTDDRGVTWTTFNKADGLGEDELPAVAYNNDRLWIATSRSIVADAQFVPVGAGFNMTDDHGATWQSFDPFQSRGAGMICYDLAFWGEAVWGACFYGGLVRTLDTGKTWTNIFADDIDQRDFEDSLFRQLSNRYFSVAVDTDFVDSSIVWAGSAAGIHRYLFLDGSLKLNGTVFHNLESAGGFVWAAHENGLSRTADLGKSWRTTNDGNGLLTNAVGAIHADPTGTRLWVATDSVRGSVGSGLATTLLGLGGTTGNDWIGAAPEQAVGPGRRITAFASAGGATWAAANNGGLIRSFDANGQTWENFDIDSAHADDRAMNFPPILPHNRVHALLAIPDGDTTYLYVGTDDDLIELVLPEDESTFDPVRITTIDIPDTMIGGEPVALSDRVVKLRVQHLPGDETVIWAVMANDGRGEGGVATSSDMGQTWRSVVSDNDTREVRFEPGNDSVFYQSTAIGLGSGIVPIGGGLEFFDNLVAKFKPTLPGAGFIDVLASTFDDDGNLWVGTDSGLAVTEDLGLNWDIVASNPDPFQFDFHRRISIAQGDEISGDFVVSLGVQSFGAKRTLWAGTRVSASGGTNGISRTTDLGDNWDKPVTGVICNNFAFSNDTVYAACDIGLLRSPGQGAAWDTLKNFTDGAARIDSNVEVFSVARLGDELWIGTEDGIAVSDDEGASWRIIRRFVPTTEAGQTAIGGAYATPVPYSPLFSPGRIKLHYTPPVTGAVTITIYDFANRRVATITEGVERRQGTQYDGDDQWDGRDTDGNIVAVGTYAFVIEYENGDIHWGKCAIIP